MERKKISDVDFESVNDRIQYIIDTLYSGTQNAFANACGVSASVINNIVSGRRSAPSFVILQRISTIEKISMKWLISGEGDPFTTENPLPVIAEINAHKTPERKMEHQTIPYYNIAARAGILAQILDAHQNPDDYIYIPNMPKCDGAIGVFGDSMHPTIKSGNVVAFNFISGISEIRWGYIYIVDFHYYGEDILCIKRVYKSDLGEEYIKLVSDNQHYPPEDIPQSVIRKIALVRMYLAKCPNI